MAGVMTVEQCGAVFQASRVASSHYGIDSAGRVGQYADEKYRTVTSSSVANDNVAVTIEVSNSKTGDPWPVSKAALEKLIDLCVDICRRNPGIKQKDGRPGLYYDGTSNGTLTRHNMFAATACPGPYLQELFPYISDEVNKKLNNEEDDDDMVRYNKLGDIPNNNGFRDIVEKLMDAQIINGDGSDPTGNADVIDLSHDQVRSLVFEYRGGAFDRKLIAMGLPPAVAG